MTRIEEVEKKLYGKEKEYEEELERRGKWRVFFPRSPRRLPSSWTGQQPPTHVPEKNIIMRHPGRYFLGAAALLLILLGGVFVFLYLRTKGQEARIEIQSSDTTESGAIITIPVVYRNDSHTTLTEGEIAITLPADALLREQGQDIKPPPRVTKKIEDLKPGEQGVTEISVRLFGQERQDQLIDATYLYRPQNLGARFSAHATKTIRISHVPLSLSWDVPETLSRGQKVDIKVHYILSSNLSFENMALQMEYPSGFEFISADPKPTTDTNVWSIGTLQPEQEGIITIHGKMSGEEGEVKAFRGGLGSFNPSTKEWRPYSESSREIKIAVTPVSIQAFLGEHQREGVINPGQTLEFTYTYHNNTSATLKNVTVKAFFEGSVLDRRTFISRDGGAIDFDTGAAVWGPGNVAKLREILPGEGGELYLSVHLKDPPPIVNEKDKNFTVGVRSTIDVASISEELQGTQLHTEDHIEFKVSSKVMFSGKTLYGSSPIPNTGPLPPKVGEKTTYTVLWEVKNFSNDMENAEVTTALPSNVKWENVMVTDGVPITFDSASNQIRWHIGRIPAGTGVLTPTLRGAFQVSVTPAEADRGNAVTLTTESMFSGIDSFTGEAIEQKIKSLNTALQFDPTAKNSDWVVQ